MGEKLMSTRKSKKSKPAGVWTEEMTKLRDESLKVIELLESDPEFVKMVEERARKLKRELGTLSPEALQQRFTI